MQIYTGYMHREFVSVEQRGKGQTDAEVDAPIQLRNDNPHSEHKEDGSGKNAEHKENGSGNGKTACLASFLPPVG